MMRFSYCNGRYLPHKEASVIHVEDRGFQFADGVYEAIHAHHGTLVDLKPHLDRFDFSMNEIGITPPCSQAALTTIMYELIRRNRIDFGLVYIQVTRGVAKREFYFPKKPVPPTLVVITNAMKQWPKASIEKGVAVALVPDQRWKRCDIKSISLLAPVLAKESAVQQGAYEAWMLDDQGYITEGASSNAWIVRGNTLQTRQADQGILNGITRQRIMTIARDMGLTIEEKPFTPADVFNAGEAFMSSTTTYVLPVSSIDGKPVGYGTAGATSLHLRSAYGAFCASAVR
ncbi:MAG: D-amino-acid transaminase [Holosporales bacterium]|jgi:D-alanine transaminase